MKKYYNEQGEQFRLAKGTISEIKNYLGRTQVYLTQDDETKKWYMAFTQGYLTYDGKFIHTVCIPTFEKVTIQNLADLCGYWNEK